MPFILSGLVEHLGTAPRCRTVRFGFKYGRNFSMPLVVGNVGTAPTIRTTRHELPLICAIFFQPNEVLWEDKNEVLVLRFRHLYNIILILHCQWG